uniref:Beta-xylanase n=1 Tax=uncultured bacterium Contigcl_1764b TaxID=1393658 RepID=W0FM95_9BACT|nr:endo-1,4-beta-xylanase [uncultured bacterium Contigcl_1764b]
MGKRLLALMMILSLLAGCCAAFADASATVYTSDFGKDEDGWYGRGAQSFRTAESTLRTVGRQSDWNSPGRDFDLIEGGKYDLSVEVRQDELDSASFMISIAHSAEGVETYENLAFGQAAKGEWTTLKGSYEAGAFDRSVLYVETTGAPTLEYEIRNFTVTAPEVLPEAKPTEPPMEIAEAEEIPSLKDIYAGKFDFGAAAPQSVFRDIKWMKLMKSQFSILTPENELKPDAVLDVSGSIRLIKETGDETAVAVHFDAAKALLNFAKSNGLKVHGHVLLWHSQTPETLFHESYDTKKPLLTRETLLGRMENYIKGVMEYLGENYPGVVVSWDVLNEAIDDGTNWLRNSNWRKIIGDDYPNYAFAYARQYAPEGTLLYYNDYNTAYPAKLKGILKLLNTLIPDGNIDGYGFQMHHSVGQPTDAMIRSCVETVARTGLKLRVSELDVGVDGNSEIWFTKQASRYAMIMRLMLEYSDQTEAVQVWGLTDLMSWRSRNYPLLFDGKGNPKPAFWAVADPYSVQ